MIILQREIKHKSGCLFNTSCLVYHSDGICDGPYGKCTCRAANDFNLKTFQNDNYAKFLEHEKNRKGT